jgi:hypothetical protein
MVIGLLGILVGIVLTVVALTIVYYVIRIAVRDGVVDANRRVEVDRVRSELGLGAERSPNSRA